jgi:isopenicillin-N epimerase
MESDPRGSNPIWGPDWPEVRALWSLEPTGAHLNHGSFGAVPIPVQEEADRLRARMESNPTDFFWRFLDEALEGARQRAAGFLGADPDGFAFLRNASTGVSTVLAGLELRPGDEVLVTDMTYGAVRIAAGRACERAGARLATQPIPLAPSGEHELAEAFLAGMTERTRLAIVDHIASPTAIKFPVERLTGELRRRGVLTLVDGAHAPGMVYVDLTALDPDFWTGNFHKWCCAPKGCGGLYARAEHRELIAPLVTSWPFPEGFPKSFAFAGTDDYTPYLALPAALDFMGRLGWDRLRVHNRTLVGFGRDVVAAGVGTDPFAAGPDELFEGMSLVALPEGVATNEDDAKALYRRLADELAIEAAIVPWKGRGFVRLSAQVYNAPGEYERLARGLSEILRGSA